MASPRIHIYPADAGGCGYYRMIWPGLALAKQGFDVHVIEPNSPESQFKASMVRGRNDEEHVVDVDPPDCDIVVLQRPLSYQLVETIHILKSKGIQVVVELDDDFDNIHPMNVAWKASHPRASKERNSLFLRQACEMADRMVVSTQSLTRYRHDAVVVPNFVPEWYTKVPRPKKEDSTPVVGWSGSLSTHPQDLQEVGSTVSRLTREGWKLRIVGTGDGVRRAFGIAPATEIDTTGWVAIEEYPLEMSRMDVGIVPLKASKFNTAKSWLKGLEWASLGVPFVASPTYSYLSLADKGIGTISLKSKHWYSHITNMDHEEEGERARARVIELGFTIEQKAEMWYNAWVGQA